MDPNLCWIDGRGYERWDLANHSKPCFGGRSAPWRGAVSFRPDYLPSSPKNARARARRVRAARLQENRLAQTQTILRDLQFDGDERHGRGAPLRAHFPDYWEGNRDEKRLRHAKGRFFLQNEV